MPLYARYGVDLVLAGHSHSYERSHLVSSDGRGGYHVTARWEEGEGRGGSSQRGAMLAKARCGLESGTVFVVTGSATQTSGGSLNHPLMAVSQDALGSVLLEIEPNHLTITHVGVSSQGRSSQVLDKATLIKEEGGC